MNCAGNWLAWTDAVTSRGGAPDTPMERLPAVGLRAKAKPRMAAMAKGATRHVMTTERSRSRRRSSLAVMGAITRAGPGLHDAPARRQN